jgi:hypothetical protein
MISGTAKYLLNRGAPTNGAQSSLADTAPNDVAIREVCALAVWAGFADAFIGGGIKAAQLTRDLAQSARNPPS